MSAIIIIIIIIIIINFPSRNFRKMRINTYLEAFT